MLWVSIYLWSPRGENFAQASLTALPNGQRFYHSVVWSRCLSLLIRLAPLPLSDGTHLLSQHYLSQRWVLSSALWPLPKLLQFSLLAFLSSSWISPPALWSFLAISWKKSDFTASEGWARRHFIHSLRTFQLLSFCLHFSLFSESEVCRGELQSFTQNSSGDAYG